MNGDFEFALTSNELGSLLFAEAVKRKLTLPGTYSTTTVIQPTESGVVVIYTGKKNVEAPK